MDELLRLMQIQRSPPDREWLKIVCGVAFEPHGSASETWEEYWTLTLVQIPHHWKSLTGWRRGKVDDPIMFKDCTLESVVAQAIAFLKERDHVLGD